MGSEFRSPDLLSDVVLSSESVCEWSLKHESWSILIKEFFRNPFRFRRSIT